MADEEHLAILKQGVETWNAWRREHLQVRPDLSNTDLSRANLDGANLNKAILSGANLDGVSLRDAELGNARLSGASLMHACLERAILYGANLVYARLDSANLFDTRLNGALLNDTVLDNANLDKAVLDNAILNGARFNHAILNGTSFSRATLLWTAFVNVDLSSCKGLEDCLHAGPSTVDHHTLQSSGPLPLAFLRGVGLPENLIDYLPSLLNQPIQMYSCFISYSSKDEDFAERLHADLQNKGVRCWFAPHDLPIGAKTWDAIDEAIRLRDKLLLILSECSIASDWVEDEVTKAFAEERRRGQLVLFPVRLDDAVLTTAEPWAGKLRDNRNIGDFTRWKRHDSYQKALDRLLRDLRVGKG